MKSFLVLLVFLISPAIFAAESTWACLKDGKHLEVKGDTVEAKKAACEAEHGQWTEEKPKAQNAGKGGGW